MISFEMVPEERPIFSGVIVSSGWRRVSSGSYRPASTSYYRSVAAARSAATPTVRTPTPTRTPVPAQGQSSYYRIVYVNGRPVVSRPPKQTPAQKAVEQQVRARRAEQERSRKQRVAASTAAAARSRATRAKTDPTAAWKRAAAEAARKAADARLVQQKRLAEARARSNAAIAARKAQIAATARAKAAREARIRAHQGVVPTKKSGVREWETYYRRQGKTLPQSGRRTIERREQSEFYRQTAGKAYLDKSYRAISRSGVGTGVSWMFSVAYQGKTMPYWDLWYDRKASATQIARMVVRDYKREIERRLALQAKARAEREVWLDRGKTGPAPTIDPREGLDYPMRPAVSAQPEAPAFLAPADRPVPRMAPGAPPLLEIPALLPPQARPTQPGQPPPLLFGGMLL